MKDDQPSPADPGPLPNIVMRSYLSISHMTAAAGLARRAVQIEDTYQGFDGAQALEHKGAVNGAILMGVAVVEAYINELFSDCADNHVSRCAGLGKDVIAWIEQVWTDDPSIERASILEKYDRACDLAGKHAPARGQSPAQDVDIAIRMRNAPMLLRCSTASASSAGRIRSLRPLWHKSVWGLG